jgi:peptide/nickel transport system substrate-binding protein
MKSIVKFVSVAILLVILVVPLLVACDDDDEDKSPSPTETVEPTQPTDQPTAEPTAEPTVPAEPAKPEGTLTIAVAQLSVRELIGPLGLSAATDRTISASIFDHLVCAKTDGSGYAPWLAESWEIAPDGGSVTFKLREGIQFHDGWGELTAEDVKFTIETIQNPNLSGWAEYQTYTPGIIDRVETSGPYTVTIYSDNTMADLILDYLTPTNGAASTPILCKAYYDAVGFEEANAHLIGTGPYKFVSFKMAQSYTLEAVDEHWRAVPEFKKVVFKEVPEEMTRMAMMQTGEADIAQLGIEHAANLEKEGFEVVSIPNGYYQIMWLLGQWLPEHEGYDPDSPFMQKEVRMAMNLAIDREEIAEALYHGMAEPIAGQQVFRWGESLDPYPYDLDRAQELMAEAGFPDGFEGEMWITTMPGGQPSMYDCSLAVAGYWDQLGIDLEIRELNIMSVYGDILARKIKNVVLNHQTMIDAVSGARSFFVMGNTDVARYPMFAHPGFQNMIEAAMAATSLEERAAAEKAMIEYVYDNYVMVPLVAVDLTFVISDRVGHWEPIHMQYLDLEYATHADPLNTTKLIPEP